MSCISPLPAGFNPRPITYFDKIGIRIAAPPPRHHRELLQKNSKFYDVRYGHPIRDLNAKFILTLVNANYAALEFLAGRFDYIVNYVEIALDLSMPDAISAMSLRDYFDIHFVQPWQRTHEMVLHQNGTYTAQRKHVRRYVWYCDRPNKITGAPHCFHLEGRHQGVDAVRRIQIREPADLLTFNHYGYWRSNLRLFAVDFERLGRWHSNVITGQRRRKRSRQQRALRYKPDQRTGGLLFRIHSEHIGQQHRSVQKFIAQYGRGPYLMRLDTSFFLPNELPVDCLFMSDNHTQLHNPLS